MDADNPRYVYACGLNRLSLRVIGSWPEPNENFLAKNYAWACVIILCAFVWLPQAASLMFLRDDLNELVGCLVLNLPIGMSVFKIVLFRLRRKVIAKILSTMAEDWSMTRTDTELQVMLEKAKYSRFISTMSWALASGAFFALLAQYGAQLITNETELLPLLLPVYFPYNTKELRRFLPTWFGQFFAVFVSAIGYSGADSSIAMFILHLCGQLASLRITLANIVDDECIKDPSLYWKRLSSIIKRHEQLNRYGESLEASFNGMLLIQMILCTITFCFQGFVTISTLVVGVSSDKGVLVLDMMFVIMYGFFTILHLFVYCWVSDLLVFENTALSYASYESDWFRLPPIQARALMMVTNRSRIPLQITAGKFVGFSLELFTRIMKTSMGYLSVLLAMKNE